MGDDPRVAPALRAAGLDHRGPYAMRHTFVSWAIAAGLPTFEIAATMGTSLEQLSKTYAHLLTGLGGSSEGGA
jgi:integrase